MLKALALLMLSGGLLCADEAADRIAIDRTLAAIHLPQVRSDPARMAELIARDFDGDVNAIPARAIWSESHGPAFKVRAIRFLTPDLAFIDGESSTDGLPAPPWFMLMKKDGSNWRIALFRSAPPRTRP
jgi:hypothetical protein